MQQFKYIPAIILTGVLLTTLGCASASNSSDTSAAKKESAGEYLDDSVITAKVKAAVLNEATLKSAEINVETYKGVVQLSGFVSSLSDINKALEITRNIKGVASVKNDMQLKGN